MKKYLIDGVEYEPILMGDIGDFDEGCDENETCHDCGCKVKECHSLHCDAQRCPACGGQFISCDCNIKVIDDNQEKKEFDKSLYYKVLGKNHKAKKENAEVM